MIKETNLASELAVVKPALLDYVWRIYYAVWLSYYGSLMAIAVDREWYVFTIVIAVIAAYMPIVGWGTTLRSRLGALVAAFILTVMLIYASHDYWGSGMNARSMHIGHWLESVVWGAYPIAMLPQLIRGLDKKRITGGIVLMCVLSAIVLLAASFVLLTMYADDIIFPVLIGLLILELRLVLPRYGLLQKSVMAEIILYLAGTSMTLVILLLLLFD